MFDWRRAIVVKGLAIVSMGIAILTLVKLVRVIEAWAMHTTFKGNVWEFFLTAVPAIVLGGYVHWRAHARLSRMILANPRWPIRPSPQEKKLMRRYRIGTNGEFFSCGGMNFDRLDDAIEYARSRDSSAT